jgi:hypothetical protein
VLNTEAMTTRCAAQLIALLLVHTLCAGEIFDEVAVAAGSSIAEDRANASVLLVEALREVH